MPATPAGGGRTAIASESPLHICLEEFDAVWAQLFLKEIIKEIANKRDCGILYTSSWAKKVLRVHGPRKRPGEWLEIFYF
jgi:hypothetical protein